MLEGLSLLAKRPKRHVSATRRRNFFNVTGPNSVWAMDFVSDALYSGKRIRALPIIDVFTRECLGIDVDQSIRGEQVVSALELIVATRGRPKTIHCDNGPEFISKVLDKWCYENGVEHVASHRNLGRAPLQRRRPRRVTSMSALTFDRLVLQWHVSAPGTRRSAH